MDETVKVSDLHHLLHTWLGWLRWQRSLTWLLRGLVLGLAAALTLGLAGLWQSRLLREEFLLLVISSALSLSLLAGLAAHLWPVEGLRAARDFDVMFGLRERVSTALELDRGLTAGSAELTRRQLVDAIAQARKVDRSDFAWHWPRIEILLALMLIVMTGLIFWRGGGWFQASQQARNVEQAVVGEQTQIEQIIKQVQAGEGLSGDQKRAILAPLEKSLKDLRSQPSLESSVSVLSGAGREIQALSDRKAEDTARALERAGSQLAAQPGSPLQDLDRDLAQGQYAAAAARLYSLDAGQMSQSEAGALAGQLQTLANSLGSANPELSKTLEDAAQALRSGNQAAANRALREAAQALADAGQQIIFSRTADQIAGQLQQGVGRVLAAGGGQSPSGTPQAGSGSGPGSDRGDSTGGQDAAGAGRGEAQGQSSPSGEAPDSPITQNNGPGDGGERTYEQIYAPSLLGGENGPVVSLPPSGRDEDGSPITTAPGGPSISNPSLVPYTQVLPQYEQVNQQAMDRGAIPASFVEIIRNYFDSLRP